MSKTSTTKDSARPQHPQQAKTERHQQKGYPMSSVKQCDTCGATEGDSNELDWWITVRSFGDADYCTKQCAIDGIRALDMSRDDLIENPDEVPA